MNGFRLTGTHGHMTADELARGIVRMRRLYSRLRPRVLALDMENTVAWILADLAALESDIPTVPLPRFFTDAQRAHALRDSGADWVLSDRPDAVDRPPVPLHAFHTIEIAGQALNALRISRSPALLPEGTAKITYTSGTTGEPKGVCLDRISMLDVAASLVSACELSGSDVHLCALPLPTLLENIGVYAMRQAGAATVVLPSSDVGLSGMGGFDGHRLMAQLREHEASTVILVPQMLAGLVDAVEDAGARLPRLRFVAVGGAPLSAALIGRARRCGLPVYEGYGLSECASVVALNTPRACKDGSVGRALPHARIEVRNDELYVTGATALGYVGAGTRPAGPWPTGDLAYLDDDGYVHLTGRRRNMFVTAFGRNVAPEWVESELTAQPVIAQAVVFGEGRPWLSAVIVPAGREPVDDAVAAANRMLPDYAQVQRWITVDTPFSFASGEITANGRLRRDILLQRHRRQIEALYADARHTETYKENA